MDDSAMAAYITATFPGVETTTAFGYTFFFYQDERKLPFATLTASDNEYDRVSNLDRPGVYRLNIGVSRPTFESLFGAAKPDLGQYDFTALDTLMPHPDYAPQNWVCVVSPGEATLAQARELLAEAHGIAVQRHQRRNQAAEAGA